MSAVVEKYLQRLLLVFLSLAPLQAAADDNIYEALKFLNRAMICIENLYVDTVDSQSLAEEGVKAMLQKLDPHSTYLSPDEMKMMHEGLDGSFEGIGVRYQMVHDTLVVINTIPDGPSEAVGIVPGDHIVMVGDSAIAGQSFSNEEIQRRLRGKKGTTVNLGIDRTGEKGLIWFNVTRDKIPVYSVDAAYMASPTTGYIRIARFAQTTGEEVEKALDTLSRHGMQDLIIDLQGNGGGYLNSAVELANLVLPSSELVVYTEGRMDGKKEFITRHLADYFRGRLVVMIDEQSASASEIFAGCMQDLDRGVIIGRRSFGKGLVQRPIDMENGGAIRLTVAHYYTPSGRCIQKPYTKGDREDYDQDILHRLQHGELVSADSIHLSDSLLFHTRGGRKVYGGGGILPDVFVPLDTTRITPAHRAMLARGTISKAVLHHFQHRQHALHQQYPTITDFLDTLHGYKPEEQLFRDVLLQAVTDSVKTDNLESLLTNHIFRQQVMATLANDLYENGAYNQVMNPTSPVFQAALQLIEDAPRYESILHIDLEPLTP